MRFHPKRMPVGAAMIVIALWLVAAVASAAVEEITIGMMVEPVTEAAKAESTGVRGATVSAPERYSKAAAAIARAKSLLLGLKSTKRFSKQDLYFVNIELQVAITHFQSLVGEVRKDSYEELVLDEVLGALGRVPLFDRHVVEDHRLEVFANQVLAALIRVPDTADIKQALEKSASNSCESKAE